MSIEETRRVVEGYLAARSGHWLAETVEFRDGGDWATGRPAVASRLRAVLRGADALELTVANGRAASRCSVPSTPLCDGPTTRLAVVWEVEAGEIVDAEVFWAGPGEPRFPVGARSRHSSLHTALHTSERESRQRLGE